MILFSKKVAQCVVCTRVEKPTFLSLCFKEGHLFVNFCRRRQRHSETLQNKKYIFVKNNCLGTIRDEI